MATKTAVKEQEITTMEELLAQVKPIAQLNRGDVVEGIVIDIQHGEILVDIGAKAEGIIVASEAREEKEMVENLKPGDTLLVYVVSTENEHGQIQLSLKKASMTRKWLGLTKAVESGEVISAKVIEYNKGGLIVESQKIRGFIPFSHLASGPARTATPQAVTEELNNLVGRELPVVVIEADQKTNRLILSEKKAQQGAEREKKMAKMANFSVGQDIEGVVTKIMPFGILVDIGDLEGLVHASEISWDKSVDFTTAYQPGQSVKVKIIELDEVNGKVNLSIKQLTNDPWESEAGQYKIGQKVKGIVTKITSYGIILQVGQVEALLKSDQSEAEVGDKLEVYVTNIDHSSRRLDVSTSPDVAE